MANLDRRSLLILAAAGLIASGPLVTGPLRAEGKIILTVRKGGTSKDFDHDALAALPQGGYAMETPWTEGRHAYAGPLLKSVLEATGITTGETITLTALNDYKISIPWADVRDHKLLLAMTSDQVPMSVRDKGPLWLLYPLTDEPDLNQPEYHARMIWQVRTIEVA